MKTTQIAIAALTVLGLAGCGHEPEYTQTYYLKHPHRMHAEIAACNKLETITKREKHNCNAAATAANYSAFYGNPYARHAAKQSSGITTSGGTLSATTKALTGKS